MTTETAPATAEKMLTTRDLPEIFDQIRPLI